MSLKTFRVIHNAWIAASRWCRVIWLMIPQILAQTTRGSKLALLMRIFAPLLLICVLYATRGMLKMRTPNYGTSLFLFYASGFLPFFMFREISLRTRTTGRILPGGTAMDEQIASVIFVALLYLFMGTLIFYGMWLYGIAEARPASLVTCLIPVGLLMALGFGVSMINKVLTHFVPVWAWVYRMCTGGLIFLSGIVYISDLMPMVVRNIIVYNPLMHAVDWFRLGVYGRYPHLLLDKTYFVSFTLITVFLGFVLERGFRRQMQQR